MTSVTTDIPFDLCQHFADLQDDPAGLGRQVLTRGIVTLRGYRHRRRSSRHLRRRARPSSVPPLSGASTPEEVLRNTVSTTRRSTRLLSKSRDRRGINGTRIKVQHGEADGPGRSRQEEGRVNCWGRR